MATEGRDEGTIPTDAERDDVPHMDAPESNRINTGTLIAGIVIVLAAIAVVLVIFM